MKLWGGRFSKATDGLVDDFHSSISFDQRLAEQDITGSIAHATMLGEQGIIPQADADKIVEGLRGILADVKAGKVHWMVDAEDIHMNVEALLTERIGEAGKRLHTGRSRNGQPAHHHARLHPPAEGAAHHLGAPHDGVFPDVPARPRPLRPRL